MDKPDLTANRELLKSLACVALSPGLHSILIFDAPYTGLQRLAVLLGQLLNGTTDLPIRSYQLGPFETDDEVWGSITLPGKTPLLRLFSPERNAGEFQLITVPDLAALSQASARTCTMLIGAGLAYLERHEQHQIWRPQQCWLAGCARDNVGKVSQHLLDRFALRIQWHDIDPSAHFSHEERVTDLLAHVPRALPAMHEALPSAILLQVEAARRRYIEVPPGVLEHVMSYLPREQYYPRREIALARFALVSLNWRVTLS